MEVRLLAPSDAESFQRVRLQSLDEAAFAFPSSSAEEAGTALEEVSRRLQADDARAVFGAFAGTAMIGLVGLERQKLKKLSHRADLWGMYVVPQARRAGVGRELLTTALIHAAKSMRVHVVNVVVTTASLPAIALFRSLGFATAGTERNSLRAEGVVYDQHYMTWHAEESPYSNVTVTFRSAPRRT